MRRAGSVGYVPATQGQGPEFWPPEDKQVIRTYWPANLDDLWVQDSARGPKYMVDCNKGE